MSTKPKAKAKPKAKGGAKLRKQLAAVEDELQLELLRLLSDASIRRNPTLFDNSRFPQEDEPSSPVADRLLEFADRAQKLRTSLGEDDPRSPSSLYMRACEENADLANPQRRGPLRLMQDLHAALQALPVPVA
jgi:hypothetical protein